MSNPEASFKHFVEIIRQLRDPNGGCPWDLEQTHLTLRPYLIEESYEVLEAIESGSDQELREELGDLLLQVVLHAQIAKDRKSFDIGDVTDAVAEKMVRRHPHVFGSLSVESSGEVLKNWESIKAAERGKKKQDEKASLLEGVPAALPALIRAQRLGEKASRVNFDWDEPESVWKKVLEELGELEEAIALLKLKTNKALTTAPRDREPELQEKVEGELGDLLFSICQLARWLGVSAEDSLRGTIKRFTERFQHLEKASARPLSELGIEELDRLWEEAKQALRRPKEGT